jgi:hypothetical protein
MAKKKRRYSRSFTVPVAIVAPLALEGVARFQDVQEGNSQLALDRIVQHYTGYSPNLHDWRWERLKVGAGPLLVGLIAHKIATKFGLNRALGRAGVPFIRI